MATIFQGVDHQVFSPSERLFEGLSPSPVETKLRTVEDSNPRADQSCNLLDEQSTRRVSAAKFVVFSGGKLEWRKGQDLVLAAFRNLLQRNPSLRGAAGAILVTAWVDPTNLRNGMPRRREIDSRSLRSFSSVCKQSVAHGSTLCGLRPLQHVLNGSCWVRMTSLFHGMLT